MGMKSLTISASYAPANMTWEFINFNWINDDRGLISLQSLRKDN